MIHYADPDSLYLCIRYTARLAESWIEQSVETVGNSYDDNALAETNIRLNNPEVIRPGGLANSEPGCFRHTEMARRVKSPASPGSHRQPTADRSRSRVSSPTRAPGMRGVTQLPHSPKKPSQFTFLTDIKHRYSFPLHHQPK